MRTADRRTVTVFEHQRLGLHDELPTKAGVTLPLDARLFDQLLRLNERQPRRFLQVGHRSLRFLSQVGVVRCGGVTFELLPKADAGGGAERPARWHDALLELLCLARNVPVRRGHRGLLELRQRDLLSVFLQQFLDELERLLREGLARTYRGDEANLSQLRGRLLVKEQLQQNLVHRERFYTRHVVFDADNPQNAMLREALVSLPRCTADDELATRARRLLASFPEVPRRRRPAGLGQGRAFARYQDALVLARWILEHLAPSSTGGADDAFAYLVDMNLLFQELVTARLRRLASPELQVAAQETRRFWPEEGEALRTLRPDLVITSPRGTLVLDTKWKIPDGGEPSPEDLRQVYVYCQYFSAARGVLLYPATGGAAAERGGAFAGPGRAVSCELRYLTLFDEDGELDVARIDRQLREISEGQMRPGQA